MNMKTVTIRLTMMTDNVKNFVRLVNRYPYDMDLRSGRYVVDAKSILGIFSIDLSRPITMTIYSDDCDDLLRDLDGYLDADALALVQDGTHMFNFSNLRMTETVEESKGLNEDGIPKVIISASGMCDAGRIRHHLKHNLWKPECTIVFVGYQGEGTLGRSLLEGVRSVKLFGEEIAVHAKIVNFQGLSSHADRDHLLAWIADIKAPKPQHVFIVHGDREVAPYFAESVEKLGFTAHAPQYTEVYDLIEDQIVAPGYLPERVLSIMNGMPHPPNQ